jgi:hypothetical protein
VDPTQPIPDHAPVVATIGEINVTTSTVQTPTGQFPLHGSQWTVTDQWTAEQKTPPWAIIAAIVTFCFLFVFSLLFLLAKEYVYRGFVIVSVTNGANQYEARIPVSSRPDMDRVYEQVNFVRALAAA